MLNVRIKSKDFFFKTLELLEMLNTKNKNYKNILIDVDGNFLILKNANKTSTATVEIETSDVFDTGTAIVNCKNLKNIVKAYSGNDYIHLTEENGKLIVKAALGGKSTLQIEEDREMLDSNIGLDTPTYFTLNRIDLLRMLESVEKSASTNPDNISVNCIRFEISENTLNLVATDTYRLTYAKESLKDVGETSKFDCSISVPLAVVKTLIKAMKNTTSKYVFLDTDEKKVAFSIRKQDSSVVIVSEVIDIQYPDYKSIVKRTDLNKKVLANTKEFTKSLKDVLAVSKKSGQIKNHVMLEIKDKEMVLKGKNEEIEITKTVPVMGCGEDITVCLNAKFLIEFLTSVKEKLVEISLKDSRTTVKIAGEENEKLALMVMPFQNFVD